MRANVSFQANGCYVARVATWKSGSYSCFSVNCTLYVAYVDRTESAFQRRQPNRPLPVGHVTWGDRYTVVWMGTWLIFPSNVLIFSSSVNVKMKARRQFTFPLLICSESDELVWAHLFKEHQDRSYFPSLHYRHSFANWMVCLYHPQKPNERWWKCY